MTIEKTGMDVTSTETGKTTLMTTERMLSTLPLSVALIVARIFEEGAIWKLAAPRTPKII